jgi:hypothetical protein
MSALILKILKRIKNFKTKNIIDGWFMGGGVGGWKTV